MLDGLPIFDLTAPTLLGVAALLLMTGRLVPRSILKDKADEAERWRLAYEAERTARSTSDQQTTELLELSKTTYSFITAVFRNSEALANKSSGGPADVSDH